MIYNWRALCDLDENKKWSLGRWIKILIRVPNIMRKMATTALIWIRSHLVPIVCCFNILSEVGAASGANESGHFRSAYLTGFFWVTVIRWKMHWLGLREGGCVDTDQIQQRPNEIAWRGVRFWWLGAGGALYSAHEFVCRTFWSLRLKPWSWV